MVEWWSRQNVGGPLLSWVLHQAKQGAFNTCGTKTALEILSIKRCDAERDAVEYLEALGYTVLPPGASRAKGVYSTRPEIALEGFKWAARDLFDEMRKVARQVELMRQGLVSEAEPNMRAWTDYELLELFEFARPGSRQTNNPETEK